MQIVDLPNFVNSYKVGDEMFSALTIQEKGRRWVKLTMDYVNYRLDLHIEISNDELACIPAEVKTYYVSEKQRREEEYTKSQWSKVNKVVDKYVIPIFGVIIICVITYLYLWLFWLFTRFTFDFWFHTNALGGPNITFSISPVSFWDIIGFLVCMIFVICMFSIPIGMLIKILRTTK